MSAVLVTGGAGAIGSNLVRVLLERGDEVVVLDDLSSGRRDLLPAGADLLVGSITDEAALAEAFGRRPARVFHLAALFANQNSVDHPARDLEVNGMGTLRVLEAAVDAGVEKVLVCSSSCVYGSSGEVDESTVVFATETPYALTKRLGEGYATFFAHQRDLDVVIVRPFNSYGPHEHPGPYRNVIPNFFALALEGQPLPITGDGTETRDFTYVEDVVLGMLGAMGAPTAPGDVFNLASGTETAILDLATRINELTGNPRGIEHRPRRAWDGIARRRGAIDRATTAFGYAPSVPLEEGLVRTLDWLRAARA